MAISIFPALAYMLISTFTPGPSNLTSSSVAMLYGYKNTLSLQAGLALVVFLVMVASGLISTTLLGIVPALEPILRYIGAAYILYLAYGILKASYNFSDEKMKPMGFGHGVALQALNPKLVFYAFTLFTSFLAPLTNNVALVILSALFIAVLSFCSTTTWALFGTALKTWLHNPRLKSVVNILLALSLVYTAISLTGLI